MEQSYKKFREELKAEQEDMSPDEIKEKLAKRSEYLLDLNNLQPQEHFWVDRGLVMSCEGAAHPNHRAYKRVST